MIRTPIRPRWSMLIATGTFVLLVLCYLQLSASQHAINPKDTTIPTASQLVNGIKAMTAANRGSGHFLLGPADLPYVGTLFPEEWRFALDEVPGIGAVFEGNRWVVIDVIATFKRLLLGLAQGVFGAVVLGVLMGCFAPAEAAFRTILSSFAKIPPTAMMAVFFVLVDKDTNMYPAMIGFGILPTLALSVYLSVKDVPDELVHKAYTLGASHLEVIWDVICKTTLPKLIDAVRLQIGPAMVFLIAAEMVIGDVGFGYRIRLQSRLLNMNVVYPYLVLLMCFGFVMDYGLRYLQRKACPWYAPEEGK